MPSGSGSKGEDKKYDDYFSNKETVVNKALYRTAQEKIAAGGNEELWMGAYRNLCEAYRKRKVYWT